MNLSPIKLGLVFTGWGILVALFAVFGAPRLQERLGIARTMYVNLALFAAVILVIADLDHGPGGAHPGASSRPASSSASTTRSPPRR